MLIVTTAIQYSTKAVRHGRNSLLFVRFYRGSKSRKIKSGISFIVSECNGSLFAILATCVSAKSTTVLIPIIAEVGVANITNGGNTMEIPYV
jgi:hypothetical protein